MLRIGNASGFYGDRFAAFREMLTGGPLDVLTGDYLAELTMLILARDRLRDPGLGYARTFLRQAEECLAEAVDRGVRIVVNAGGLNPARLAEALGELAGRQGVDARIGYVAGDELLPRAAEFGWTGEDPRRPLLAANAYLGAFGIAECLRAGANVVVTGRVTDAALVAGPGIAHHGWTPTDLDALAGAVVAGHVLECGAQATGGNYAFFAEHGPALDRPGFPLAELHADGSSVITKHPGTGGVVTVETVTAQLLYETGGPRYLGPDVTARLDTVTLTQDGPDRVRIDGVRGEAPPATLKVGLNRLGGHRNELEFVLTGLDIEAKAALVQRQLTAALTDPPAELRWTLARTDHPDADTEERASARLRVTARDPQEARVGRALTAAAVELGLAGYPGFHLTAPPGPAAPYGVFEARELDAKEVEHLAHLPGGRTVAVPPAPQPTHQVATDDAPLPPAPDDGPTRRAPLGLVAGARSGDKGGDANLGVWARSEPGWRWLAHTLTTERLRELLPETAPLTIERHLLPNLRAVNFTLRGLLGEGVAAQARFDPQAKALGEWLRSRHVDIPEALL
ncbi:exopolyphosphatase [Kitasatospora cheerisanensis KCTC 2395]|uniref:Exopolyphosphatase n=1 Tax=Kitasatospora cheerisanensis KCTC 2395 TaxID=1348663 RepID=A0A066YRX7_9ACTN|nr:acyclic terpene utilization AtuA family protein [Kitasatospora cheerisanensis]KDN80846.1 exopolyphosphatase [Kitasatospora cheerisanensis KCTC 2395]